MEKEIVLKQLLATDRLMELVASEHQKDLEYIKGMLVNIEDMRGILIDSEVEAEVYVALQEYDCEGVWNELRIASMVMDMDAPEEQTVDEWAGYLAENLQKRKTKDNEDYEMLARENKAMAEALKKLGYTDAQVSDIANGAI